MPDERDRYPDPLPRLLKAMEARPPRPWPEEGQLDGEDAVPMEPETPRLDEVPSDTASRGEGAVDAGQTAIDVDNEGWCHGSCHQPCEKCVRR